MEPATKNDLKDLMKELLKELKEDIKEAVAEAFGNSKPALEHATTPAASQLLSTDAPASPTTIVDVIPVLAASAASAKPLDIDSTGVVPPTPTICSTECPSRDATASTAVFTLGTTPTSATATIDVTPVFAASVVTNDFTTPSRLLQAAAPALIHELKVLRPLPWPSFKGSQGSTLGQLEKNMNHTEVPSVGITVQETSGENNNIYIPSFYLGSVADWETLFCLCMRCDIASYCFKHLVHPAVGKCLLMIRHMGLFPGDELLFGGAEIILLVWPLECLQSLHPELPWLSILTHVGIEVEERGLHLDVGLILQAWYYYLGTHGYSCFYFTTEDITGFVQIVQQLGNTELKGNRLSNDISEKGPAQLVFKFRSSKPECRLGKSTEMLEWLPEFIFQKLQHVGGGKIYGLNTPWNPGDLAYVVVCYWLTTCEQEFFQGGRDAIALDILVDQVYGVLYTAFGVQNLLELNKGMHRPLGRAAPSRPPDELSSTPSHVNSVRSRVELRPLPWPSFESSRGWTPQVSFNYRPDWILLIRPSAGGRTSGVKFWLVKSLFTKSYAHEARFACHMICRCILSKLTRSGGYTMRPTVEAMNLLPTELICFPLPPAKPPDDHDKCIFHWMKIQHMILVSLYFVSKSLYPSAAPFELYDTSLPMEMISHIIFINWIFWAWGKICVVVEVNPMPILVDGPVRHWVVHICAILRAGGDQCKCQWSAQCFFGKWVEETGRSQNSESMDPVLLHCSAWELLIAEFLQVCIGSCLNGYSRISGFVLLQWEIAWTLGSASGTQSQQPFLPPTVRSAASTWKQEGTQGGMCYMAPDAFLDQVQVRHGCCIDHACSYLPSGHNYYLDTFLEQVPSGYDYYVNDACFFDLVQVNLNRNYYRDYYHGDSGMIKDLQAPWDPGELFLATAWGQAVFQEGRGVSDLTTTSPAIARHEQGPAHLPAWLQIQRERATRRSSKGSRLALAAALLLPPLALNPAPFLASSLLAHLCLYQACNQTRELLSSTNSSYTERDQRVANS